MWRALLVAVSLTALTGCEAASIEKPGDIVSLVCPMPAVTIHSATGEQLGLLDVVTTETPGDVGCFIVGEFTVELPSDGSLVELRVQQGAIAPSTLGLSDWEESSEDRVAILIVDPLSAAADAAPASG